MVSNAVKMDEQAVVAALKRLRAQHSDDPHYKQLRKDLPAEWPI
ncbi:MAG TPA: hypothetical protein VMT22_02255 [Terriglobales bacterium]|jgi:hypothetical protein|nr:hypothetical protein [Terriglobales bacterium]